MIKRKQGLNIWVFLVLAWALIRAYFVNNIFQKYGVDGKIYLFIDLASSIPYAICSGKALFAYLDRNRRSFIVQSILATIFFYLPDLYIFLAAKHVPTGTYFGLVLWVLVMSTLALLKFRSDKLHQ